MSPHLQVYRLPLNGILSISHRLTGIVLALGAVLVVALLIAAASGSQTYNAVYDLAAHWLGQIVLLGFTAALYFHFCAGIRHFFWDAGYGYDLATAQRSSYAILVAAVVLTVLTWVLAYTVGGG